MIDALQDSFLRQQRLSGRYEWHATEYHFIRTEPGSLYHIHVFEDSDQSKTLDRPYTAAFDDLQKKSAVSSGLGAPSLSTKSSNSSSTTSSQSVAALTSCVFQRSRPKHKGGLPDKLPFRDENALRDVFSGLSLPASYFQVADGSPTSCHHRIIPDLAGVGIKYEFAGHWVTKKGDWALALSHHKASNQTSVFWSLDHRMDSHDLMEAFKRSTYHPMVVPCIMFDHTFLMSKDRRSDIKDTLAKIESDAQAVHVYYSKATVGGKHSQLPDEDSRISDLFKRLQDCRNAQESQEGRRQLWRSFYDAIHAGLSYSRTAAVDSADPAQVKAHEDLEHWAAVTWNKMQNLLAREDETIRRTNIAASILRDITQLRENRLQATIARASKRDSEDMKFIALLGSVFVPASFIATVLNIPAFQFLRGAKLFGAYIGITIPLVLLVIVLCLSRNRMDQKIEQKLNGDSKV